MSILERVLLVGFAGALGTITRYLVGVWALKSLGATLPYGTLIVNLVGCFLIAAITHVALSSHLVSPTLRLVLTTGFLGGLTTYSSFNLETTAFLRSPDWHLGLLYLGVTVVGSLVAGLLGVATARALTG